MSSSTAKSNTKPVVLRARHLSKSFGGEKVLDAISLELTVGDIVLLRGVNGSGKTTLINILTGNLPPDSGEFELHATVRRERFLFPLPLWKTLNPFDRFQPEVIGRAGLGRTWQEVRLFPTQTVRSNVAVAVPSQIGENPIYALFRPISVHLQESQVLQNSLRLLEQTGLKGREHSLADRISFGQAKRVAIARALNAGAKILMLDEPLAGLDSTGVEDVIETIRRMAAEGSTTLVIIEHVFHIPRLLGLATSVWTLDRGKLVVQTPSAVERELALGYDVDHLQLITGSGFEVTESPLPNGATLRIAARSGGSGQVLLEIDNLCITRGARVVIGEDGLSFKLREGELALLQAPNGWGKTSLLEAVAGVIPYSGSVRVRGKEISGIAPWMRARIGISLMQARNHIFSDMTVNDNLSIAGVEMKDTGLEHLETRYAGNLSGGEKQALAIASSVDNPRANICLLDEPFAALDTSNLNRLSNTLIAKLKTGAVLVVVPHPNTPPLQPVTS